MAIERRHIRVEDLGETKVVHFVDANVIFGRDITQEIGLELYELVESGNCRRLVLDFTGVSYFSSEMLGKFISLWRRMDRAGGTVALRNMGPVVKDIFSPRLMRLFELDEAVPVGQAAAGSEDADSSSGAD